MKNILSNLTKFKQYFLNSRLAFTSMLLLIVLTGSYGLHVLTLHMLPSSVSVYILIYTFYAASAAISWVVGAVLLSFIFTKKACEGTVENTLRDTSENTWIKIKSHKDLPPYGTDVIVYGTDERVCGVKKAHVCQMDDLEDGVDFATTGRFWWLTENGTKIQNVTHWCELHKFPDQC